MMVAGETRIWWCCRCQMTQCGLASRALPGQALHKATAKPAASAMIVFVEVLAAGTRSVSRHGERLWSAH